ncbi:MAG TPA: hypothetical protein VN442_26950 [Bryobacteraceae bacterium]|nr:hypothetical protein [Bryobacteraceae bacterium]
MRTRIMDVGATAALGNVAFGTLAAPLAPAPDNVGKDSMGFLQVAEVLVAVL